MNPIVNTKDVPLELHVRQTFSISQYESNAEVVHILSRKMAQMIAEKIIAEKRFFDLKFEDSFGMLRTDVIVMTTDEFFDWSKRKFKDGMEHAQGFMPPTWDLK